MTMERQILEEHIPLPVTPAMAAGLHRLTPREGAVRGCVLMLHGLGQNGDVFLNQSKDVGLAYTLVDQGYEVFICTYRGRNTDNSVLAQEGFGWQQLVTEDLPLIWRGVEKRCKHAKRFLVGYQQGGVLWSAFLARNPEIINQVSGMIYFNPYRVRGSVGWLKQLSYGLWEQKIVRAVSALLGYVPSSLLMQGKANESRKLLKELHLWQSDSWQDEEDGFDYHQAMTALYFPPSLYFISAHQRWLRREDDSRAFMFELAGHDGRMIKLSSGSGNKRNYSALELCTHQDAEQDYYPVLLSWLQEMAEQQGLNKANG